MNKFKKITIGAAMFMAVGLAAVPQVFALGFANPDQDARATGQGEAFVAQADDASAIFYNPAGLTQIKGTEFTSGAYLSFVDEQQEGAGNSGEMNSMAFIPHLYLSSDLGMKNSPWRFGLGFNVPFGNVADYNQNGPFKYLVTTARLEVLNIQPTVAYQVNDHLSLGAGLDVYYGDTALNRKINASPFPDGRLHFDGNGFGLGATAGLLWKITEQHAIGITYHSPFAIKFQGTGILDTPASNNQQPSHATIQFPQSIKGGYAFRPIPKLKLEADIEWINWDTLNSLILRSSGPLNGAAIPFNWKDSLYYEFGTQYDLTDHWALRAGYIYSVNTVPTSTFSPSVPDSNRQVFSGGFGYSTPRYNIDLVYQYSLSEVRNVNLAHNGTAASGTWHSDDNAVMITTSLKF